MKRILAFSVMAYMLVGCAASQETRDWQKVIPTRGTDPAYEAALVSGDQLELALTLPKRETTESYRLRPGDEIRVDGITGEPGPVTASVAPDGTIALPLLGQITAAGKTLPELSDRLTESYRHYIREPRIVAQPLKLGAEARALQQAFSSAEPGQAGLVLSVDPDGYIDLPMLGPTQAAGRRPTELSGELTSRYDGIVPGAQVTVNVRQLVPRRVFVLGVVNKPGEVNLIGSPTLLQALAQVGGWRTGADLSRVTLFRRGPDQDEEIHRTVVDLAALAEGDVEQWPDVQLAANDVVIVPGTGTYDFNQWVDQVFSRGIWRILPFSGGVSVGP